MGGAIGPGPPVSWGFPFGAWAMWNQADGNPPNLTMSVGGVDYRRSPLEGLNGCEAYAVLL